MVRLYNKGVKTQASLISHNTYQERSKWPFDDITRHQLIYSYKGLNNQPHSYAIYPGEYYLEEYLSNKTISIIYNPENPTEAIESKKLNISSNFEYVLNILLIGFASLLLPYVLYWLYSINFSPSNEFRKE